MKRRFTHYSLVAASLFLLSSCATILNGGDRLIVIDGNVKEPVTVTTELKTYKDVTLPVEVKLDRHDIGGQHIQIVSAEHEFDDIVVKKKFTGYTAWNLPFLLCAPGMILDMATNSNVSPRYTHYFISPKGEGELLCSTEPFRPEVPISNSNDKKFYRHELSVNIGMGGATDDVFFDAVDKHVTPYGFDDFYMDFGSRGPNFPLSIDYMYNLNRRLAVGGSIGKGHISEDQTKAVWTEIDESFLVSFYNCHPKCRSFHVMPSVRYKWWISGKGRYAAYSQLYLGYARTKFKVNEVKDEEGKVLLPAYSLKKNRLGYQVTFAGIEFGGGHLRSYIDLGYGYRGIFNFGMKYCF